MNYFVNHCDIYERRIFVKLQLVQSMNKVVDDDMNRNRNFDFGVVFRLVRR